MALYLVTGGAGFIGSNIVEHLVSAGEKVRVLDNFSNGREENLAHLRGKIELTRGDIRDRAAVSKVLEGADFVLHQAALGSVPRSIADPLETNSANVDGTLLMLHESARVGVKRFVYASSSSVYGSATGLPKREDMACQPISPYGVSKYVGELYCRIFHQVYGVETVILRYFNVFGRRQDPMSQYAAVIPRFITALCEGQSPVIYGDGTQTRDFTFVDNVVQANLKACTPGFASFGDPLNIACGGGHTLLELYDRISCLLGREIPPSFQAMRSGEVMHSFADISKARSLLGYEPSVDFKTGLEYTVAWYRQAAPLS
ncbi:MAG: SDR family oxidoreductase [Candidatus Eremiobacteraeota bacterium]|nr:SDR family oxidoreductase [Candidatus Eremiobacteraeota bacterium]